MGGMKFASKVHLGVRSNTRVPGGPQYLYYQVANQYIDFQVDMGVNMGMYSGVSSRSIFIHTNFGSELYGVFLG